MSGLAKRMKRTLDEVHMEIPRRAGVILWRWSWLRLTYCREVRVMSEHDNKETLMSGCAGCGEAMDFDPDDPRPEFEFQCEHCQKINIVIWGVGEPPHWYTEIKPN
ncbi:hypothetical protein ACIQUS_09755 [Pseudomonas sp. NPDC090755]|uniref:hypothetical protein n=1 Tax=Pseudomonas sp. NPDC090755 TaxID=3364481 RepID=UPI00383AE0E7